MRAATGTAQGAMACAASLAMPACLLLGAAVGPGCSPEVQPPPAAAKAARSAARSAAPRRALGVCPPYKLRDEQGQIIDPVAGINADKPYSPRQTCGQEGCHDYKTITEGYHFTQGKGEAVPAEHKQRYAWVTSPGQYGGRW